MGYDAVFFFFCVCFFIAKATSKKGESVIVGYGLIKEARCSFYEFSKPIRFCSNLVETIFNPFSYPKMQKKLGVTMLVFKMALIKVPLITRAISLRFFLLTLLVGRQ